MDPAMAQIQYVQTPAQVIHPRNLQIPDAFLRSLVLAKSVVRDVQFKCLVAKSIVLMEHQMEQGHHRILTKAYQPAGVARVQLEE